MRETFDVMHTEMLEKARAKVKASLVTITQWKDFVPSLNDKKLLLACWCNTAECEKKIKVDSSEEAKNLAQDGFLLTAAAKSLCIPADQTLAGQELPEKCFHCDNKAVCWGLFGRSY